MFWKVISNKQEKFLLTFYDASFWELERFKTPLRQGPGHKYVMPCPSNIEKGTRETEQKRQEDLREKQEEILESEGVSGMLIWDILYMSTGDLAE